MSPGINNKPRSTGTLPKSNRNTTQPRISTNQESNWLRPSRTGCPTTERANNLLPTGWRPISEREAVRVAIKNSNKRSTDFFHAYNQAKLGPINYFERHTSNVYDPSESVCWWKMTPPVESGAQPPTKPTNTDKMPDRGQVESRLNQIRDYIKVTSSMMESLSQSNDPRAQHQREKLSRMVEDLYDSEQKLSKLLEDQHKLWNENGDPEILVDVAARKQQIEESERKLAELQAQQQQLDDMQNRMKERLDAAREAQRVLLLEEEGVNLENEQAGEEQIIQEVEVPKSVQLERDAEALRNQLLQLKTKKSHVDHLVSEIQAFEAMEQSSCKSENSRGTPRDKRAELELMKAQLSHLKALMDSAVGVTSESYQEREDVAIYQAETDNSPSAINEIEPSLPSNRSLPNIEEIHAVTRELKEQSALLQVARAELLRLKQGQSGHQNPSPSFTSNSPPPNLMCNIQNGIPEKKQANNAFSQIQNFTAQCNPMQAVENKFRKDFSQASGGQPEWESRRGSTSRNSQSSTPGNLWPPQTMVNGQINIDGVADNVLELGSQVDSNCWGTSNLPINQSNGLPTNGVVGTAEYYRQLLMGSQSQQLQMMCTTIQQCCQLLWAQQREIQSLKNAMNQLTLQLRDSHSLEVEGHSNLTRPIHRTNGDAAESSTLPPSSSLPNLVTLPNVPPVPPRSEQTQLNNQVPPGNRANNYWDNFRSYSRQNLLSGNSKTHLEHGAGAAASTSSVKEKSNRENYPERHLLNLIGETEEASYSQNLNLNSDLQQPEVVIQPTDTENFNEISCAKIAEDISKRDDLRLILMHCLQILTAKKSNSPAPSNVISNTSYTSDDESEAGARAINPINLSSSTQNFTANDSFAAPTSTPTNNQNLDFPNLDDHIELVQNELIFENLSDEIILDQFGETIPSRLDCSNNNQVTSTDGIIPAIDGLSQDMEPIIISLDPNVSYDHDPMLQRLRESVIQNQITVTSQNLSPNQTLDNYQGRQSDSQNSTMYSF